MTKEYIYPSEVEATATDLLDASSESVIHQIAPPNGHRTSTLLINEAHSAIDNDKNGLAKILWLLGLCCSLHLQDTGSTNNPYRPKFIGVSFSSFSGENLSSEDLNLLSQAVEHIKNIFILSRIYDLLWLYKEPKDFKFSLASIDNYLLIEKASFDIDEYIKMKRRAASLCRQIDNEESREKDQLVFDSLKQYLQSTSKNYEVIEILEFISEFFDMNFRLSLVKICLRQARQLCEEKNFLFARRFLACAQRSLSSAGAKLKPQNQFKISAKIAETYVIEAQSKEDGFVAAHFYEKAIQSYRGIPRRHRSFFIKENFLDNLQIEMQECNKNSLSTRRTKKIEIEIKDERFAEWHQFSKDMVKGKDAFQGLLCIADLAHLAKYQDAVEQAEKSLSSGFIAPLISSTVRHHADGRVVAKSLPHNPEKKNVEKDSAIWQSMVSTFAMHCSIQVQFSIMPSLLSYLNEYRLSKESLIGIANNSPMIPSGSGYHVGLALYHGLDLDFATSLHLCTPQIENYVRCALKSVNCTTTTLDRNGIETEKGLSTLIQLDEAKEALGEDLAFQIEALFCDSLGANLRNEVAHGLVGSGLSQSYFSIYAWWLLLWITLLPYKRNDINSR